MHRKETKRMAGNNPPGHLRGLLALNGALLAILGAVTFGATADAQLRGRGEYTMVAGNVKGANAAAVFIVDSVNQEMVVVAYNPQTKGLDGVGYANLAQDALRTSGR
ncbi:MAG: hypothetical protein JSV91_12980 [Phycisphaerales bacterium]|nr:MAG: hypothetical protein JSV91_12980 [Phycisphaerales bacterium]